MAHLKRLLGAATSTASITTAELQSYVNRRSAERDHGRTLMPRSVT